MRLTSRTILTSLDVVLILLLPGLSGINLKEHSGKHFEGRYTRNIDDYEILIPRRINEHGSFVSYSIPSYFKKQPNRKKRSIPESSQKIHYDLSFDGKPHLIEVWPNHDFLSPGLITETWGTGAPSDLSNVKIRSVSDDQCHYLGKVKGDPKSNVALSLCDGMVGHIRTKRHHYFIEPVKDHAPEEDGQHLHIIYTRSVNIRKPTCGIKSDWRTAWQKRFEKEFKERKGALTDLKADHRERIKKALANSSVSYSDKKRSSESNINYMETLLVADRRFLEYHKGTDYQQYLFTILNMAAELFHDVSVGSEFELSLVRVIFLEKEENELDLMVNADADATLADFCKWADSMNFDESHPNHHDIALLVTKHDICSEGDCDTTGLAYVSGACSKELSGAYCEDTGLDLGVIITHEIGHLLGSEHDTDAKNPGPGHCSAMADDYRIHVMAPWSQYSAANWSVCSRKYISEFLENDLGKCFLDEPQEHDFEIPEMPPGVIYDAEWQCTQQFGPSKPCSLSPDKFCKKLACKNPDGKGCVTMGHPPADGTSCGNNKWCYERQCVDIGGRPEAVNGGWSEWSSWSECSRTCGGGATYQERMCDNPLPANHGRFCLGHKRHYKLCNTQPCDEDALTFREVQCEEHDTDELKWIPFDDELAEHVCALVCSNNKNKYRILAPRVKDGTSCKRGGRDKCIAGECRKVGCDSILDSDAEEDKCGVCNGDGSTCMFYEKMITKTTNEDYQKLLVIPAGCRKITIEEVRPNANFLALGAADGKTFYLNGNYEVDEEGESKVAGTVCVYSEEEPDQETIIIGGPIKEDLVVYMLYNGEDNTGIHCQYSCPLNSLFSKKSSSNSKIQSPFTSYITEVADAAMQILSGGSKNGSTHSNSSCTGKAKHSFHWEFVDWGPCSAFCNGGSQISEPSCIDDSGGKVSKTFCKNVPKPQTISRICNDHPCKIRWRTGEWGKCNGSTDNPGFRHRLVECVKESPFMDGVIITDDKNCKKEKPVDQESCKGKELSNKSAATKEVTKRRNMVITNEDGCSKTKSKIEDNLENEDKENGGSNMDNDSKMKSFRIQVNMKDYEEEDGCPNENVAQNTVIPSNETLEDYDEKGGCSNNNISQTKSTQKIEQLEDYDEKGGCSNNNISQTKSTQKIEQLEDNDEEKGCSNKNNVSKTKSMPKIEKVEDYDGEKGCANKTEGSKNRSLVIDKIPSNKVKVYEMSLLEDRKKFNMSDAAIDAVGDSIPSIVDECKEKIFSGEKAIKEIQEIRKKNEETANDGSDEEEGNVIEESGCNNTINSASKSIQSNDQSNKQIDTQSNKQTDTQSNKQTDTQSNKQTDTKQLKDSEAESTVNADDIDGKSTYKINIKKHISADNIDGNGTNKFKMNEKSLINLNKVDKHKNNAYAEDSEDIKYSERMYKTNDKLQEQEEEGTAKLQERDKRSKAKTHNAKQKEIKDDLAEIAANGREVEDYNGVSEVAQGRQINSNFNKIQGHSESTSEENQDESEIDNIQAKDSEKLCENECKKVMCGNNCNKKCEENPDENDDENDQMNEDEDEDEDEEDQCNDECEDDSKKDCDKNCGKECVKICQNINGAGQLTETVL